MARKYQTNSEEYEKGLDWVSTPRGDLGDITYRAVNILKKSAYILCEDTRVSKILLNKYAIKINAHKQVTKKLILL